MMSPQLHHGKALLDKPLGVLHPFLRGFQFAGAGIGQDPAFGAAQHLIDGQFGVFSQGVPHGHLYAPGAEGVQRRIDQAGVDGLYLADVLANQQGADMALPDTGQ